ncbi:MAG: type I DNA topoisomerase [Victivallales bacterium]|nr:type I DNA topoisomerase [Victivallales bacterium]
MDKKLVIVESPAKARTIGRILGGDYVVSASMGHVRDLPEKSLGIDIEKHFEPMYVETNKALVSKLKSAAKDAAAVYLAPDPDREGEAIAWHLQELLSKSFKGDFHRVAFHEITKGAVSRAFESPGKVDTKLVDAQQARRILDRLVGYQISPLLWTKIKRGVSAGRVQSVALRMVCDREREILAFVPVEFWMFAAEFEVLRQIGDGAGKTFKAKLVKVSGAKPEISNEEQAGDLRSKLSSLDDFCISSVETKPVMRNPSPPLITSTMQQASGFSASQTMRIAQQLYEGVDADSGDAGGLITYMRTDSFAVSTEAQQTCRSFISANFGTDYVPEKPNFYKSKSTAQGAHEAIRPTDVSLTPEKAAAFLDAPQLKLYTLIWKRFVASQMSPARMQKTTVDVDGGGGSYTFRAEATEVVFPGFNILKVAKADAEEDTSPGILKALQRDDRCKALEISGDQKFTEPPPRFTEATLIRELEANGIGRPSTYATIVRTIQNRDYCQKSKKGQQLSPTPLGFEICDYLVSKLPELFDIKFTSDMESKLDDIEEGKVKWRNMLDDFYSKLSRWLDDAKFANAPETGSVGELVSMLSDVSEWHPPEKRDNRVLDDSKFFASVKRQFDKDGKLTEKQWKALLSLALKYKAQISGFDSFADDSRVSGDMSEAIRRMEERLGADIRQREHIGSDEFKRISQVFTLMANVRWEEPSKGNKAYDDGKFFSSLKKQSDSGRPLSEKQLAVLRRLAQKYLDQIESPETVKEILGIKEGPDAHEAGSGTQPNPEIEDAIGKLSEVTTWAEPSKKGRRVFDDKQFFESLRTQYHRKHYLSSKQEFALKKLAAKYLKQ